MKIKKFTAAFTALLLSAALASCQLSEVIGKNDTTAAQTTASDDIVIEDVEPMDLINMDLSGYIRLGQYKGIKVNEHASVLTDAMLEEEIKALLDAQGHYAEIKDRAVREGDVLNINFAGFMNGEKFEGGSADNQPITISDNSGYIEGFADGLVGATPGETVRIDLTFPADYYEDLASKAVSFDVTVNYIQGELIIPAFDDAFAADHSGGKYTTAAEYRESIRKHLEDSLKEEARTSAAEEIWYAVNGNAEILSYPDQQVRYYFNMIKKQYSDYAASYNMDLKTIMMYMGITEDDMLNDAKEYTENDLVLYAIIKAEGISLSDGEYLSGLEDYASDFEITSDELVAYYGEAAIRESLLKDKVYKLLYEWADVSFIE